MSEQLKQRYAERDKEMSEGIRAFDFVLGMFWGFWLSFMAALLASPS